MFLIVAALYYEAKPLISHFQLKKEKGLHKCEIYSSGNISLIISGTGMIKSAASTAYIIASKGVAAISGIANIGICGAASHQFTVSTPILFNKIVNTSTGRAFYPDMLISSDIFEGTLHSFSGPVLLHECPSGVEFVDMEAAGFAEAALMYLPPHMVNCLKAVSDHLDEKRLEPANISNIINDSIPVWEKFILQANSKNQKNILLTDNDMELLSTVSTRLKFSTAMKYQLRELFLQYKIHTGKSPSDIPEKYLKLEAKSKNEGKVLLQELRGVLTGE